jgi:hypothetical protein
MAMAPGKINAASAGAILKRAKNGRKSSWNLDTWDINPWGSGVKSSFNEALIKHEVQLLSDPQALARQTLKTNALGQGITDLQTAQANLKTAQDALTAKRALMARTGKKLNLSDEIAAVDAAKVALGQTNAENGGLYDAAKGGNNNSNERGGANPRVVHAAAKTTSNPKKDLVDKANAPAPVNKPKASDINRLLGEVRKTGHIANSDPNAPGLVQANRLAANNRAITAAVDAAIASGLAQFKGKSREQVKRMLVAK